MQVLNRKRQEYNNTEKAQKKGPSPKLGVSNENPITTVLQMKRFCRRVSVCSLLLWEEGIWSWL